DDLLVRDDVTGLVDHEARAGGVHADDAGRVAAVDLLVGQAPRGRGGEPRGRDRGLDDLLHGRPAAEVPGETGTRERDPPSGGRECERGGDAEHVTPSSRPAIKPGL